MRAAIVYKDSAIVGRVAEFLKNLEISCDKFDKPSKDLENYDFIVSIGGDGTILSILQAVKKCPPIFGINTGRIGLLTHSTPENFREKLREAIETFETEEFPRICCLAAGKELLALNEVVLMSERQAKLLTVTVKIDGVVADRIRCDGMIVATQIGSTGYAFSAGGPVIEPYLNSFIVIPLAPFRFGWKPIVVRSDRKIELESTGGVVIADGQSSVKASKAIITKSKYPAVFFKREDRLSVLFDRIKRIE